MGHGGTPTCLLSSGKSQSKMADGIRGIPILKKATLYWKVRLGPLSKASHSSWSQGESGDVAGPNCILERNLYINMIINLQLDD